MKISLDLNYILKRVIVVVLAFVIISSIKSCEVFAESVVNTIYYTAAPSRCRAYNGSSSSWSNGSVMQDTENNTYLVNWCKGNGFNPTQLFFPYTQVNLEIGKTYNVYFTVFAEPWTTSVPITSKDLTAVVWNMSTSVGYASDVNCSTNVGEYVWYIDNNNNYYYAYQYDVICKNVTINPTYGSFNIKIYQNEKVASSITRTLRFDEVIDTEAEINNSINSTQTDSNTQNANGIFDTDSNGQSTNSNMTNHYGLESIITSPIAMLSYAQNQCQPVSFTLFGKSITLPCGDTLFWNRDFSSYHSIFTSGETGSGLNTVRDNFRAVWNLLFGGAIIFHLLLKLYEVIQKALDPVSDEYVDIRSAIDIGSAVRDTDGDIVLDKPKVHVSALGATNVDSYLMTKGV